MGLALGALGCTPHIGDSCTLSTDCSAQGDRLCDTAAPGGYCTIIGCQRNSCPDEATCVLFNAQVQGCSYSDRIPSRTARSYCMATCGSNSDCRDGYICANPHGLPWDGKVLDDNQTNHVCIYPPVNGVVGGDASVLSSDAAVCQPSDPSVPGIDASVSFMPDAGAPDTRAPDAGDSGRPEGGAPDGSGGDASDAGVADAPASGG